MVDGDILYKYHGTQRIDPNYVGDPLTFHVALSSGQNVNLSNTLIVFLFFSPFIYSGGDFTERKALSFFSGTP